MHAAEPLKNDQQAQLNALYAQMEPEGLYPLWEKLAALVLPKPDSPAKVHKWSYDNARDYLMRAGDLISVPRDTKHWFDLCDDRRIRAIRLFQDTSGWTPHYVEGGVHGDYIPLCMGPAWVPASGGAGR